MANKLVTKILIIVTKNEISNKNKEKKMQTLTIKTNQQGTNGFWGLRLQINEFVKTNFELLYEGAARLGKNLAANYYAPRRIQINRTRLHSGIGLKYASEHKYNDACAPSEEQLIQTVSDIQILINAATEDIAAPFLLKIIENK